MPACRRSRACRGTPDPEQAAPARAPREASREGSGLRPAEKGPASPESRVLRSSTQGRPGGLRREGESARRSRGPSDRRSAGQGVWKARHPGDAGGGGHRQVYPGPAVRVQKTGDMQSLGRVNGERTNSSGWRMGENTR